SAPNEHVTHEEPVDTDQTLGSLRQVITPLVPPPAVKVDEQSISPKPVVPEPKPIDSQPSYLPPSPQPVNYGYAREREQPFRPHAPRTTIKFRFFPRVLITPEAYQRMLLYVDLIPSEVGWLGTVRHLKNQKRVLLPGESEFTWIRTKQDHFDDFLIEQ